MDKLKIFIAEDEPLCRQGFRAFVTAAGHEVIGVAADGMVALEKIPALKPDLVIMDINMPGISGLEVIRRLNQDIEMPYIIVTAYKDPALLKTATDLGVFGYLIKPVDEYEIRSAIQVTMARFEEFGQLKKELGDTKTALEERKLVERAKGIMMEKCGVSEPQAMKHLQKMARDQNRRISEVAKDIISADKLFRI